MRILEWPASLALRRLAARLIPMQPKRFLQAVLHRWLYPSVPPYEAGPARDWDPVLLPEPEADATARALDRGRSLPARRPDVVCFSTIDGDPGNERSQQLMLTALAAGGRRVLRLSLTHAPPPRARPGFTIRPLGEGVHGLSLAGRGPRPVNAGALSADDAARVLDALEDARRALGIDDARSYVMSPSWNGVALAARERFGWPVVALHEARESEWAARAREAEAALAARAPLASVVVVTHGNLALTRLCLESVLRSTQHPRLEVIVVDNASTDGTPALLRALAERDPRVRAICNDVNRGFAAANNQGLRPATGDVLVLLNNDTVVPPGWLGRLARHLEDPEVGLVGPVTSSACNEARVPVGYRTVADMERFAAARALDHDGEVADLRMLAMFCIAFRRSTYERLGPLDEAYGIGMFEDDDYAERARAARLRVVCAADTFVHHVGQASFRALVERGEFDALHARNRAIFEARWGPWRPHVAGAPRFARHGVP